MKKSTTKKLLAVLLVLTLLFSGIVTFVSAESSNVKINVGGQAVAFTGDLGSPFIDNQGRTMVPFRAVANFMNNVGVDWDNDSREAIFYRDNTPVTISGTNMYMNVTVRFPIGTNQAWQYIDLHNGKGRWYFSYHRLVQMDTLSQVLNGRTYAPIRFLAEGLGYDVGWEGSTRTVLINEPAGDWGANYISKYGPDAGKPVTSEAVAQLYANEFRRVVEGQPTGNDTTPVGRFNGFLGRESKDVTGWVFKYTMNGQETFVYINDKGQTWYHDDSLSKDVYTIWR